MNYIVSLHCLKSLSDLNIRNVYYIYLYDYLYIFMVQSIKIPRVDRDERIGSAFNELFKIINDTERTVSSTVRWNFDGTSFFHPFFLAPLSIYKENNPKQIIFENLSDYLGSYFNLIHFGNALETTNSNDLLSTLSIYVEKSYIPICRFSLKDEKVVDGIQATLQGAIQKQSKCGNKVYTVLSYLLGELVCNMSQHSQSKLGYIYSQLSRQDKCINICLADNGITVYGSYVKTNKYIDKLTNEAEALRLANTGHSTKESGERGFGLSSSRQMLVEGLGGSFFMLSGGAFYRYEKNTENYIELPKTIHWNGTIILLKIPTIISNNFNIYDYIR